MRFFYLSVYSFVFIASITLIISTGSFCFQKPNNIGVNASSSDNRKVYPPLPVFSGNEELPNLSTNVAIVVDLDSGVTLYQKNSDVKHLPASTTKITTALVALDYYSLDEVLPVNSVSVTGQKMNLVNGEKISVKNLIYGLLVYSANDAAEVLAQNYPGGRESFIRAMNLKIQNLGFKNTYFENPSGLDGSSQYTTARDLAGLSAIAMQNDFFREVVGTEKIIVGSEDGTYIHRLTNINKLLGEVDGVLGIKTGWTENAKENLVSYVERGDRKIITVVLGSRDRFGDSSKLIEWIFRNFTWVKTEQLN